jgi:hypothetical protein
MRMKSLGIALVAMGLATGGALAQQQAPQVKGQQGAPGTGTSTTPGMAPAAPRSPGASNMPTSAQPPQAQGQQSAPGTGTANAPGQKPAVTTGAGGAKGAPNTGIAPGTNTQEQGSAAGTGTAAPTKR